MCGLCLKNGNNQSAEIYCKGCGNLQCYDCADACHKGDKLMKEHQFKSVNESLPQSSKKPGANVDLNGLDFCKKHRKPYEYFCQREKALACGSCALLDHNACEKIVKLDDIDKKDEECNKLKEKLELAIPKIAHSVQNVNVAETCLSEKSLEVQKRLVDMREKREKLFEEFANNVTDRVNEYKEKTSADWTKKKHECESKIKSMKTALKMIGDASNNGTPVQRFIAVHTMKDNIQQDLKTADSLCTDLGKINVSCNCNQQFDSLKKGVASLMVPGTFEIRYSVPMKSKLKFRTGVALKKDSLYTGLDFLPDGRLVAVDNNYKKCLVFDENLNQKSEYQLEYYPYCVAVISHDEFVVTTGGSYRLDFLSIDKSNKITLSRTYKVKICYYSVSVMNDTHLVVSTFDHSTPVRIVSTSGVETGFDIMFPAKKYPLGESCCTYIRGMDKIVFTDLNADLVFIYDIKSGEKIVIKHEWIRRPVGVAVGRYNHVFVCCVSDSYRSLVEITPTGRCLYPHIADMTASSVAVSKNNVLAATNCEWASPQNKKLKLYDIVPE